MKEGFKNWWPNLLSLIALFPVLSTKAKGGIILGAFSLSLITFFFRRKKLFFKRTWHKAISYYRRLHTIHIVIAFSFDTNGQVVSRCNELLESHGLKDKINFYSEPKIFSNQIEAQDYLLRTGMYLLVWSNGDKDLQGKFIIHFTHLDDQKKIFSSILKAEFDSVITQKEILKIFPDTLETDLDIEQNNLAEVSFYIAAFSVLNFVSIHDGQKIFELLVGNSKNRDINELVRAKLQKVYLFKGDNYLRSSRYPKALEILQKAYDFDPNNIDAIAGLALAQFKNDYRDRAEELVLELQSKFPNHPVTHVDIAYFRIASGNYKNALKHYEKYQLVQTAPINLQVSEFLAERIQEDPGELGYLFAKGFMLYQATKEEDSKRDLTSFIRRAPEYKYQPMIREAKRILGTIK